MLLEKIEFREALQILAKRAGVELKTDTVQDSRADEKSTLQKIYAEANIWYHRELWTPEALSARNYLSKRWINQEIIDDWSIWFSSDPREMFETLKKKGFSEKALMDSGIFVSQYKDRFFHRIIFPICNYRGDVIAFTGRTLSSDSQEAKYVNSPETLIFHKSDVLFGIHKAKNVIQKEKKIIVVEWQMDVISAHQHGIYNVVGISGTALTDEHIRLIRRLTDQIYLCLDSDSAGKIATFRSIENLQNEPVDVYVISLPGAKDIDEYLWKNTDFAERVALAVPAILFMIEEGMIKHDITTTQGKKWLLDMVLKHIISIHGTVEIDQALRLLSKKLDMSLQTLYSEYNRTVRGQKRPQFDVSKTTPISGEDLLACYIIGFPNGREVFEKNFLPELKTETETWIISRYLNWDLDGEEIKHYELRYEILSNWKTQEVLMREFEELITSLNKSHFRKLQKEYSQDLPKLQTLLQLGRTHSLI